MTPGIYVRVSSDSQTYESQERELQAWAKGKEDVQWFRDTFTGTTLERPQWSELWRACCEGRVDTVVIWRLDRLGRTARGLITLRDELIARKLNLISLRDAIDLSTASGRLMFNVIASVAEFETEVRRERQIVGIAAAKAKGTVYTGRAKGQLNERTKELAPTVYALQDAGVGIRGIAATTKLSREAIRHLLTSRKEQEHGNQTNQTCNQGNDDP